MQCPSCGRRMAQVHDSTWLCPDCDPERLAKARSAPWIPESYLTVLWLSLITLGVYWHIYLYRAFREIDEREGRNHLAGLYWLHIGVTAAFITTVVVAAFTIPEEDLHTLPARLWLPWSAGMAAVPLASYLAVESYRLGTDTPAPMVAPWLLAAFVVVEALVIAGTENPYLRWPLAFANLLIFWLVHRALRSFWEMRSSRAARRQAADSAT